jgi:tRNA(adenine34) deaminase
MQSKGVGALKDDGFFMRQALGQARRALQEGEFPVGCVLVHGRQVVASGARRGTAGGRPNEVDHAEMVALRRLVAAAPDIAREDVTVYCTMEPCLMCFAALTLNRIGKVVYAYEDVMGGGTRCDPEALPPLYRTLRPRVVGGVLRAESLDLFQVFFAHPANRYWQGSALATYTLEQKPGEAPPAL